MSKIPEGLKCEVTPEQAYPKGIPKTPDGWEFARFEYDGGLYMDEATLEPNGSLSGIRVPREARIIVRRKSEPPKATAKSTPRVAVHLSDLKVGTTYFEYPWSRSGSAQVVTWPVNEDRRVYVEAVALESILLPADVASGMKQPMDRHSKLEEVLAIQAATKIGLLATDQCLAPKDMDYIVGRWRAIDKAAILAADIAPTYNMEFKSHPKPFCPDCGSVQHGTSICPKLQAEENSAARAAENWKRWEQAGTRAAEEHAKFLADTKPRRWVIEDNPGGFAIRDSGASLGALHDCKIISEVKPVTIQDVIRESTTAMNSIIRHGHGHEYVDVCLMVLRKLGIEVAPLRPLVDKPKPITQEQIVKAWRKIPGHLSQTPLAVFLLRELGIEVEA